MALILNPAQVTVIESVAADIQEALLNGVDDGSADVIVPPMQDYNLVQSGFQTQVVDSYRAPLAALLVALGLPAAVGLSVTIPLAKLTLLGTAGSLTFTNGVLTAAVAPT
jgi:hypothetical protein